MAESSSKKVSWIGGYTNVACLRVLFLDGGGTTGSDGRAGAGIGVDGAGMSLMIGGSEGKVLLLLILAFGGDFGVRMSVMA